jgi:hypothetical protein
MNPFLIIILVAVTLTLPISVRASELELDLIQIEFPTKVGKFEKKKIHHYDERAFGYQVKYLANNSLDVLDVYIYPVDDENKHLSHEVLVTGYFSEVEKGIEMAVSRGMYTSAQHYGTEEYQADDGKIKILRSRHTIVKERKELLSHSYLTEHNGVIIKIRVSILGSAVAALLEEYQDAAFTLIEIALNAIPES